ncbi:hypothetical protein O0880_22955 [Janthinobacterium sp. SUN118]|uniref:hypothetical protein n=1 Tax=Janthinobacterium sp. SUN118 TaxID=3004100 RepID=UPI0025AFF004|nr:hypothetical protein [Janthinobacterium sp. SUN118]MDN2712292.1 hypothetical protein [Janthinobacterium sp. SUN118]
MSGLTPAVPASTIRGASPASRALRQADDGIGTWLSDLVTGSGSSPAHIIITGILGVVPGVGQAMDARDLILGIIVISKSPSAIGAWVELAITLVGCVPAVGDTLKVGFKLMNKGHNFGRVLEAVSPKLRGNVEKFMRKIDWNVLAHESKGLFKGVIDTFIDGIDSWVVKAVAGKSEVKLLIQEMQAIQKRGPKMIEDAFAELKKLHGKMMGHDLPHNTAAVGNATGKTVQHEAREVGKDIAGKEAKAASKAEKRLAAKKNKDVTGNQAKPNSSKVNTKKKGEKKKQKWRTGVPAEHITDYFVKKRHALFKKANNAGKLTEEHSVPHTGLDHLWFKGAGLSQPFIVGETKSSIFDSFRLMAALPADLQEKFSSLRADEAANPTPNNNKPNIFDNADRDAHANQSARMGNKEADEKELRKGLNRENKETKLPTQMSHAWIARSLKQEKLTATGLTIKPLMKKYATGQLLNPDAKPPYLRWISLVTGRQLNKHRQSKGSNHEIQLMLDIPDNILRK